MPSIQMRASVRAIALLVLIASASFAQRRDTVVRIADRPLHAGVATLQAERSIGSADGADPYLFGRITLVAVARDGSIYVYDAQVPALRKYDVNGRFVKQLGGKGAGPGEYGEVTGLAVLRDGRVAALDRGNSRVNIYTADGAPATQILSGALPSSVSSANMLMADTADRLYIRHIIARERPPRLLWIRASSTGTVIDTLQASLLASHLLTGRGPNGSYTITVPYAPEMHPAPSPLGFLVTGTSSRYAFEYPAADGRSVVSVRRNVAPIPIPTRARDSIRDAVTESFRKDVPGWSWNGPAVPSARASFDRIDVGNDGRVWVTLPFLQQPGVPRPAQLRAWDVFEPSGAYVGQVSAPLSITVHVRRGDYVWGVETDASDVQRVVRYRIVWK
jgi:hypothetical protein